MWSKRGYNENSDVDTMLFTSLADAEIEKIENRVFDLAQYRIQEAEDTLI